MRQIVLDTETTGLEVHRGDRLVEIGCIELVQRQRTGREFHRFLNPERAMSTGASEVTGITDDMLSDKPLFREIADEFLHFIDGAELIAHNASFDVGFIDAELARIGAGPLAERVQVVDTLALAREKFPGQRNNLNALCKRLDIDFSHRTQHGALLDANLLVDVYLALTSGQGQLGFDAEDATIDVQEAVAALEIRARPRVLRAVASERDAHEARLRVLDKKVGGSCLWRALGG